MQNDDDLDICCAHCGYHCTHQGIVEVFNRDREDADMGMHVRVDWFDVSIGRSMVGNPSSRRQGLRVHLTCESCQRVSFLEVVQHKGSTQMAVVAGYDDKYELRNISTSTIWNQWGAYW